MVARHAHIISSLLRGQEFPPLEMGGDMLPSISKDGNRGETRLWATGRVKYRTIASVNIVGNVADYF